MDSSSISIAELKREFVLAVGDDFTVIDADPVADRLLAAPIGRALRACAAPGADDKLIALVEHARREPVTHWEAALLVNGAPATVSLAARQVDGAVVLVGNLIPEHYASALVRVGDTLNELAALNRETDRQQRELLRRNQELTQLTQELEDSARGVVALHHEVDEKSDSLRRITEVKSRVVANVSHEFRTPLNAIIGLARLLLSRTDGDLAPEQEKQLTFILRSAESLTQLVNDLLDLARIEAGKAALRPSQFTVNDLFGALRGMFRPLQDATEATLVFEDASGVGTLETDDGKVSQILKNLISNALKFTPSGTVRVTAAPGPGSLVTFAVIDTGIGIAPQDHARIFEEFAQVEHALQRRVNGTGLGLSVSQRLAEILGGSLTVASAPGRGSTFTLAVPRVHPDVAEMAGLQARNRDEAPDRPSILVVEDDRQTLFLYEKYLAGAGYRILAARSVDEARRMLARSRPVAVVLDIMLDGEASWSLLSELKTSPDTRDIPVIVVTVTNREQTARALGADEFVIKPLDGQWLTRRLAALARRVGPIHRVLVIDDDEVARYMLVKLLSEGPFEVLQAATGADGVAMARERLPQVIFLDFVLPGMTAFDVLDELKIDPATRHIPVIIHTSKALAEDERTRLSRDAAAILPKQNLSREVALGRIREVLAGAGVTALHEGGADA
jgi:signal transduction histidine kinase/CheY-like chemotaxis protein